MLKNSINIKDFRDFVKENTIKIIIVSIVIFLVYGRFLWHLNYFLDNSVVIGDKTTPLNWLELGRYGGVFSRVIFNVFENFKIGLNYNPYFEVLMAGLITLLMVVVFSYLINKITNVSSRIVFLIFMLFLIHPIWVMQIYFTFQILPVMFAALILIIATILEWKRITTKNNLCLLITVPLLVIAFSTYQNFVIFYVTLVILSYVIYNISNKQFTLIESIKIISNFIAVFILSFILNTIINKFIFNPNGYISGLIAWKNNDFDTVLNAVLTDIKHMLMPAGTSYETYTITLLPSIIILLICVVKNYKKIGNNIILLLSFILLNIMPFALVIATGNPMRLRTHFILPLVVSANILISLVLEKDNKIGKKVIVGISLFLVLSQTASTQRVIHGYDVFMNSEYKFMNKLLTRVEPIFADNEIKENKIVFVGKKTYNPKSISTDLEAIYFSNFGTNYAGEPKYYESNLWATGFLNVSNEMEFVTPTKEELEKARHEAVNMQSYPATDSIKLVDDFVVVKLSEDEFYNDDFNITE